MEWKVPEGQQLGACTGCCLFQTLFQTLNPKLWAAPSVVTLNKLYAGRCEPPGTGFISFPGPAQVAEPAHGEDPAARRMLRCQGQDRARRRPPRECVGLGVQISRGAPSQRSPSPRSLRSPCRLPAPSARDVSFPPSFPFFPFFFSFFLPGRIVQRLMVLFYMNH